MLGQITKRLIRREADMLVIPQTHLPLHVTPQVAVEQQADVVVITADSRSRDRATAYLDAKPTLRVICVSADGRSGHCFSLAKADDGPPGGLPGPRGGSLIESWLPELDSRWLLTAIRGTLDAR
jgi:hypothetical protein